MILPLVAVVVDIVSEIPQWNRVVVNVIVHVDESRVNRPPAVNLWNTPDVRSWRLSVFPDCLNHAILDEHVAPVEYRVFRVHGDHPALEDVLAFVDVVAHCVAGTLQMVRADVGAVVG